MENEAYEKPLEFSSTLRVGQVYEEEDELDPTTYQQDYKVVQKSLVAYTCVPKKMIVLIMIIGAILALLALCVAIYFMFFRYLLGQEIAGYVTVVVTEPPTVPVTTAFVTTIPTVPPTTPGPWRCPVDVDLQPTLCTIAAAQGLCDTQFGQSQCCYSCPVDPDCFDLLPGCYKVLLYGACTDPIMNETCCASCAT